MRNVGYRWKEIIQSLDARSRLNMHWQRSCVETSLDGYSITVLPIGREVLVFEGDAELIQAISKAAESVTKTVRTPKAAA